MTDDSLSILSDLLILVDQKDYVIGYKEKDICHQGEGILHRAFSIFIFNDQKQLLIQKRSNAKLLWPLYWSNSVCSHPRKGESYREATVRRLKEELGFETELKLLFKFNYRKRFNNIGTEYEMCSVYIGNYNADFRVNRNEIAEWKHIDLDELNDDIKVNHHLYTPWFTMEWERIRKDHIDEIVSL